MNKILILALLLSLAFLFAPPIGAAKLAGVTMDDSVQVGEEALVLNGLGLRKKAIFKIYVGGLYLPAKATAAAGIFDADASRRMIMHVLYKKLSQEQLADGWNECLEANTPQASAEVKQRFEQLNSWMEEVRSGERLVFTYTPQGGTEIEVKGTSKGKISGKAFADALFACWIGEVPATEALREGLLGG